MLEAGDTAPDFTLPDQHGEPVTLSDLRGQTVVLYFYPRADTPGCTTQACGIRDHRADYEAAGARVLGVSPDTVEAIAKFDVKHGLDFTLLADPDHVVADAYGTWVEKTQLRQDLHGRPALDLRHRPGGQDRRGDREGVAEDARRGRAEHPQPVTLAFRRARRRR